MKHRQPHPRYLAKPSYMNDSVEGLALARVHDDPSEGVPPMPKTVAGIRVDERIAAAALVAIEQGFRAEAHPDGKGLTLFSPDSEHPPVRVNTFRSTPQRAAAFKSDLRKAGVVFEGEPLPRPQKGQPISLLGDGSTAGSMALGDALAAIEGEERVELAGDIMDSLGQSLGMPKDVSNLATLMFLTVNRWVERGGLASLIKSSDHELASASLEALNLAEQMEREKNAALSERDALQARLDRAEEKAHKAAQECGEAIKAKAAADERALKAENDLATIRRLLNGA